MSHHNALGEPDRTGGDEGVSGRDPARPASTGTSVRSAADQRLVRLMKEFSRRQRERPDLVVRPWWSTGDAGPDGTRKVVGFVVEYCPRGVESAELAVRPDRVRVEGPGGFREAPLDLAAGWSIAGDDVGCAELMANHLLAMADRLLEEAA